MGDEAESSAFSYSSPSLTCLYLVNNCQVYMQKRVGVITSPYPTQQSTGCLE